jgi:hypothetical protein
VPQVVDLSLALSFLDDVDELRYQVEVAGEPGQPHAVLEMPASLP